MSALDPSGTYCQANGHATFGCPGGGPQHIELYRLGFGVTKVPGPTDAELREETRADRDLMADQFHGRDIDGGLTW